MLDRARAGSAAIRAAAAVCLVSVCSVPALAQLRPAPSAGGDVTFFPRSDFFFSWSGLKTPDPRFSWDGHLGVDLDLLRYPTGRINLSADYEAVLGSERRVFDINHENYFIEASATSQIRGVELGVAFHHESRHLSDRPNTEVIAWNLLEARAGRRFIVRGAIMDARFDLGGIRQHAYVDYSWTADLHLAVQRPLTSRVALFATSSTGLVGINPSVAGRDERQCGSRFEAGVHLNGVAGALEVFLGYERRIDAYPLDRTRQRWFAFGFRLTTR